MTKIKILVAIRSLGSQVDKLENIVTIMTSCKSYTFILLLKCVWHTILVAKKFEQKNSHNTKLKTQMGLNVSAMDNFLQNTQQNK